MKKYFLIFICFLIIGCSSNSHKLCCKYNGILPAASNPGINTTLILNENGLFKKDLYYIDEKNGHFTENGTYSIKKDILTTTSKDESAYYKIEKNQLRQLDSNQQEIKGPLAPYYILKCVEKDKSA